MTVKNISTNKIEREAKMKPQKTKDKRRLEK